MRTSSRPSPTSTTPSYGLQAGLLTRDAGRILTAYRELEVGALIVGDTPSLASRSHALRRRQRLAASAAKASAPPSKR